MISISKVCKQTALLAFFTLILSACGGGGGSGDCERVTAVAEGYGDIEIHNDTDGDVMAFFPELAFGATMRANVCEQFGVPAGTRSIQFNRCDGSGGQCDRSDVVEYVYVTVEAGEQEVLKVSDIL
ncbi:MAG: hypothetical protein JKY67_20770 [Pseudomonadales bacterium]|nr:hypothetical protein [Pseudomonadales bacterium]